MKVSIDKIAKIAGVSTATVSRVINNNAPVGLDTRTAVLKAIKDNNYVPRGQRGKSEQSGYYIPNGNGNGTLELIFCFSSEGEDIKFNERGMEVSKSDEGYSNILINNELSYASSFYRSISEGITDEARKNCYKTVMHCIDKSQLGHRGLIDMLKEDGASGLLLAGEHPADIEKFIKNCPVPVVLVDIIANQGPMEITTDNFEGIAQAFDYLHSLGHRDIGFTIGNDIPEYNERYNAFAYKMVEKGLQINTNWIYRGSNRIIEVGEWAESIFRSGKYPTAFLNSNDFAALGVMRGAINAGLKIPENVSIIGFDDIESAQLMTPSLSTVRVPKEEIGRLSLRELLVSIKENGKPAYFPQCRLRVTPALIKRESVSYISR